MDWNVLMAVGVGIVVNIIIVAYGYGKLSQKVDDAVGNHNSDNGGKNNKHSNVFPECLRMFEDIRSDLGTLKGDIGEVKGKVNTLIELNGKK